MVVAANIPEEDKSPLARDTGTPPEVLDVLSRDARKTIVFFVANNTGASYETLIRLFKEDARSYIRDSARNTLLKKCATQLVPEGLARELKEIMSKLS